MTDHLTPEQRSAHMARIHGGLATNRIERKVHEALKGARIRHRMYPRVKPSMDVMVFTARGPLYIAIDGCFWHACPQHYRRPKSRVRFWKRHVEVAEELRRAQRAAAPFPWAQIWEHWVRDPLNARDMTVGITQAAIAKVEAGAVAAGQIELTWDDINAVWRSWR